VWGEGVGGGGRWGEGVEGRGGGGEGGESRRTHARANARTHADTTHHTCGAPHPDRFLLPPPTPAADLAAAAPVAQPINRYIQHWSS